jgi:hypothetical protein
LTLLLDKLGSLRNARWIWSFTSALLVCDMPALEAVVDSALLADVELVPVALVSLVVLDGALPEVVIAGAALEGAGAALVLVDEPTLEVTGADAGAGVLLLVAGAPAAPDVPPVVEVEPDDVSFARVAEAL